MGRSPISALRYRLLHSLRIPERAVRAQLDDVVMDSIENDVTELRR